MLLDIPTAEARHAEMVRAIGWILAEGHPDLTELWLCQDAYKCFGPCWLWGAYSKRSPSGFVPNARDVRTLEASDRRQL